MPPDGIPIFVYFDGKYNDVVGTMYRLVRKRLLDNQLRYKHPIYKYIGEILRKNKVLSEELRNEVYINNKWDV